MVTLLYIANPYLFIFILIYIFIYKNNELESTFIEIANPRKLIILVRLIYRHPATDFTNFNCNYLNKLLEKEQNSKEQKYFFILGNFNLNLLNYNEHNQTN